MTQIEIQVAKPEDAEGVTKVHIQTWLATYPNEHLGITLESIKERVAGENGEKIPAKIEKWRKSIESQDETHGIFVAKSGDRVLGFVGPRFDEHGQRRIGAFYVLPEAQGQGVGSKLMQRALEWHGNEDIYLHVASYNQKAIEFYKRFGFEETGHRVDDEVGQRSGEVVIPEIEMVRKASN